MKTEYDKKRESFFQACNEMKKKSETRELTKKLKDKNVEKNCLHNMKNTLIN